MERPNGLLQQTAPQALGIEEVGMCDATWVLALATVALAIATFWNVRESRKVSQNQIGVQTWLALEPRFDSKEMKLARKKLARLLDPYDQAKHDQITEEVLEFFESLGTVYNLDLVNKALADSSFSFYVNRWWEAAKPYIDHERLARGGDKSLFHEFEKMATAMHKHDPSIDSRELKEFLDNEKRLKAD